MEKESSRTAAMVLKTTSSGDGGMFMKKKSFGARAVSFLRRLSSLKRRDTVYQKESLPSTESDFYRVYISPTR